jgi:hypothetical protein
MSFVNISMQVTSINQTLRSRKGLSSLVVATLTYVRKLQTLYQKMNSIEILIQDRQESLL